MNSGDYENSGGSWRRKNLRSHNSDIFLWTLREVAEYLRVSEKTVRRRVAQGTLPCVRIGRGLRFQPSELLRWLDARKEG